MPTNSTDTKVAESLVLESELKTHLDALGLNSVDEYTAWCARHGFGTRIDKHWKERCRERYFAAEASIKDRLKRKKREKRRPRRIIERILDGDADEASLTQPHLVLIHEAAASAGDSQVRNAFRDLLLHVEGQTGLLTHQAAVPQSGDRAGSTFLTGLLSLAYCHRCWIRSVSLWTPRTHNVRRQFSSLARHLLAKYPVPEFMDSVWFGDNSDEARRQQAWFTRIGAGESPRRIDLPIPLTKRMARHFMQAPNECSVEAAVRWAQVMGLGGDVRLTRAILGSRIGDTFDNNEFWETVIRWLVQNAMLDPTLIGPLIDYVHRRRFDPLESDDGGEPDSTKTACSQFSMKGRTAASLIRQMREWHAGLRKQPEKPQLEWPESGVAEFDWTEGSLASKDLRRWTIIELLSRKALHLEGRMMRHCVASYDGSCAFGGTSIWSLGVERNFGRRKRVMTIEVANTTKKVCQIRGKANRLPSRKELSVIQRWASQANLTVAGFVGH